MLEETEALKENVDVHITPSGKARQFRNDIQRTIDNINREIYRLEEAVRAAIADDPDRARRDQILRSVPGIGPVSATILCAEMPELGTLGRRQAASLIGLAPFPDDSGKRAGIRYIRGGRIVPRNALYRAAMTAIRHNSDMNRLYQRLVDKGKPHKVAMVAVIRKMIILANVLLRDDRKWSALAPAQIGG